MPCALETPFGYSVYLALPFVSVFVSFQIVYCCVSPVLVSFKRTTIQARLPFSDFPSFADSFSDLLEMLRIGTSPAAKNLLRNRNDKGMIYYHLPRHLLRELQSS